MIKPINKEAEAIRTLFFVQTKEGVKVPFVFNHAQQSLDKVDNPYGRTRILIAKARQHGFSTAVLGKFTIRCLGNEGRHAVIMSHEADATQRLLDRSHYFLKHIRGPKPVTGRNSRNELYFSKTESTYYVGTAGSRAFGRGDFITDLHCSEYAWWIDPVKHATGMFQAVPYNGRIYIESTGNGRNNDFYYMWQNAVKMGYERLFYPWWAGNEYEVEPHTSDGVYRPDLPRHQEYLLKLQAQFTLNDRKMQWYEDKLKELREDLRMMQQEYPSEPEECFQASGGTIFQNVVRGYSPLWLAKSVIGYQVFKLEGHPTKSLHYCIGADPSGGTGNDDAAINIFCTQTGEQVLEFHYNTVDPITFAKVLVELAKLYNEAYVTSEGNNHGAAVTPYVKTHYLPNNIYKSKVGTATTPPKYGWYNTNFNKHQMIGLMQEWLDQVTVYGEQTTQELKAFEETEEGQLGGKSDNLVIATGLAMMGLKRFNYLRDEHNKPAPEVKPKRNYSATSLEEILKNLDDKRRWHKDFFGEQVNMNWPAQWN